MPTFVGIYIYPDVEVLDFTGPYEVFTTATRLALRDGQPPPFSTSTIAARKGLVRARAGLVVQPNYNFANHPPIDLLIIPGGVVTSELENPEVVRWSYVPYHLYSVFPVLASRRILHTIQWGKHLL